MHNRTRSAALDEAYIDHAHETKDETPVRNLVIQGSQSRALDVAASAGNNRQHTFVFPGPDHVVERRRSGMQQPELTVA